MDRARPMRWRVLEPYRQAQSSCRRCLLCQRTPSGLLSGHAPPAEGVSLRQGEKAMLGSLGFPEVLLIFVIVLFVFGTRRLGDLGKGLGEGIRNFKRALKDADKEEEKG